MIAALGRGEGEVEVEVEVRRENARLACEDLAGKCSSKDGRSLDGTLKFLAGRIGG